MDRPDLRAVARPEAIAAAVVAHVDEGTTEKFSHGAGHGAVSVRTAEHRGHEIVIRTSYEIVVDGRPFDPHVVIDNAGRVHYHGLPTRDFASMVDLVQKAIDAFPDDFADPDGHGEVGHGEVGHGDHGHGDHGHGAGGKRGGRHDRPRRASGEPK